MVTLIKTLSQAINLIFIGLLRLYRLLISPLLGQRCRFYPSCSQYAIQALQQYHIFAALWLIVKRLIKCHPGHPGGIDEIPIR